MYAACLWDERCWDPVCRFVDTTLNRAGKLFSQDNMMLYADHLKTKYPDACIKFLADGLGVNTTILGADPLFVITGVNQKDIHETQSDDWVQLDPEKVEKQHQYKEDVIAYPFVYPKRGYFTVSHVVIILVDRKDATIYYYDPQGLTSDDPARLQIFKDDLDFNMHENLIQLARVLFPNDIARVVENLSSHQIDPINCGTFVCRVLRNLYQGKSVEEALMFNPVVESPLAFKREMGQIYLRSLGKNPGQIFLFDFVEVEMPKVEPPDEAASAGVVP